MSKYTKTIEIIRREAENCGFVYYNANPAARFTDDCVIRAISQATDKSWDEVFCKLSEEAFKVKLVFNDERVYGKYLCSLKWRYLEKPIKPDQQEYTVRDFLREHPSAAIIHVNENHICYVNNGVAYDTRNPEDGVVGTYWIPP